MKSHIPNTEGYIPESASIDLTQKRLPESPVGLKRKLVLGALVSVSLIVGFVVLTALSHKPNLKTLTDSTPDKGQPSDVVRALPEDYSKIPQPKPTRIPTVAPKQEVIDKEVPVQSDDANLKVLKDYEL